MKHKKKIILFLTIFCMLFTGCWDKVEIDRKTFISTIGLDPGEDIGKAKELKKIKSDDSFQERELKKMDVTYGFPNISELGGEQGGSAESKQIETKAYSMQDAVMKATAQSSRNIHLGHTKLLIISEDLLKYETTFKEVMDYFQRSALINRMMFVAVCKGKAKDYVKFKPQMEKNIENYFTGLMENSQRVSTIIPVTLNEFLINLANNGNAILPRLEYDKAKKEVELKGLAVIKNYKLKGNLDELETSDLEILRGKIIGGKKVLYNNGHPIDFVIDGIERTISFSKKDKLNFNMDIKLEGYVANYYNEGKAISNEDLIKIQNKFSKLLSTQCVKTAKLTQKEFDIDIIGFNEYIRAYHPIIWKEIKDKWEEKYKEAKINVDVKVAIRRIGISN